MFTTEAGLVRAIIRAVRKYFPDAWIFKVHGGPYQTAGVPDLLLAVNGALVAMEAKFRRPGESLAHARGRVTPQQKWQLAELSQAGAIAGIVTSVEEALSLMRKVPPLASCR